MVAESPFLMQLENKQQPKRGKKRKYFIPSKVMEGGP
jgi:hypothetical protein